MDRPDHALADLVQAHDQAETHLEETNGVEHAALIVRIPVNHPFSAPMTPPTAPPSRGPAGHFLFGTGESHSATKAVGSAWTRDPPWQCSGWPRRCWFRRSGRRGRRGVADARRFQRAAWKHAPHTIDRLRP